VSGLHDAIVLAGRRAGEDPFAAAAGAVHRALIPVGGEPMLERVLALLRRHPRIGSIRVSIDRPDLVTATDVVVLRAADSPSASVLEALDSRALGTADRPVLLTTADHALLDEEVLDAFLTGADSSDADVGVGLVREDVLRAAFPHSQRTYLRFRGGAVSGANLFALRTERARRAVEFWQRVETLRKQPWRLVRAFGPSTLALFALRRLTLDAAFERASRAIGARARPVVLPFARAAIDVDKPADLELVEQILAGRGPVEARERGQEPDPGLHEPRIDASTSRGSRGSGS
jgi:GTP:adenosylcobinamide-phosphate guanylyltransferase